MYKHFSSEFFTANRARLRTLFVGTAPIVLSANGLLQRNSDMTFPFRQDSSFWYFTGVSDPDVVLVMDKSKDYLIVPNLSSYQEVFDGTFNIEELQRISGIETIYDAKEGWRRLENRIKKSKHVATLPAPAAYVETFGMYSNPARAALIKKLKSFNSELELLDIRTHIARLRMVKQPNELAAIQEAIDITVKTIRTVRKKKFDYERDLETAITSQFRKYGAPGHGFTPVVASGERTCLLHYIANNNPIDPKGLIVVDIGAEIDNYSADITRTYCQGTPTKRQKDVYQAVKAVHEFALAGLKPGVTIRQSEQRVEEFMGEKLRELGLIKIIDKENVRKYYSHATSHFLGLDAHDMGDYDAPLQPNMVLTVEPGIYIPEEKIGVRIEDDIMITPKGYKLLSKRLSNDSL